MRLEVFTAFVDPGYYAVNSTGNLVTNLIVITYSMASPQGAVPCPAINTSLVGVYFVNYSVTSGGLWAVPVVRTVMMQDTTPPVLTLVGGTYVVQEAAQPWIEPGYSAVDIYSGNVTSLVVIGGDTVNVFAPSGSTFVISYTATDPAGNVAAVQYRSVRVLDTVPPVLVLLGQADFLQQGGTPFQDPGVNASDAREGSVVARVNVTYTRQGSSSNQSVAAVDIYAAAGTVFYVLYRVRDLAGNSAIPVLRRVTIIDTIPPVITLHPPNPEFHEGATPYFDPGWYAIDLLDGNITSRVNVSGTVVVMSPAGSVCNLSYNVRDRAGNAAIEQDRMVTIVDHTKPVITLLGQASLQHQATVPYVDAGAIAWDTLDGNLTSSIIASVYVNVFAAAGAVFNLTYRVQDAAGNWAVAVTRRVVIIDTIPPVLTLIGGSPILWQAGAPYVDPGYSAIDTLNGDLTALVNVRFRLVPSAFPRITSPLAPVNLTLFGPLVAMSTFAPLGSEALLIYNVSDVAGNIAIANRTVRLADHLPPVLSVLGDSSVTLRSGNVYSDAGAVAFDGYSGDVSANISISVANASLASITAQPGFYTITYTAMDAVGNKVSRLGRAVSVLADVHGPTGTGIAQEHLTGQLTFDMSAATPTSSTPPVAYLGLYVPLLDNTTDQVATFLQGSGAGVAGVQCLPGEYRVCAVTATVLSSLNLQQLRDNSSLVQSVAQTPLPVSTYYGVLDCNARNISASEAIALLVSSGVITSNVACTAALCTFQSATAPLLASVGSCNVLAQASPSPFLKHAITISLQPRAELTPLVLVQALRTMQLQPSSASCDGAATCVFRTYDPVHNWHIAALLAWNTVVQQVFLKHYDRMEGTITFNQPATSQLCTLVLLQALVPPCEIYVNATTCVFRSYADIVPSQAVAIAQSAGVASFALDTVEAVVPAWSPVYSGSIVVASPASARAALARAGIVASAPLCTVAADGTDTLSCVFTTSSPASDAMLSQLLTTPGVLAATAPQLVDFATFFSILLAPTLGKVYVIVHAYSLCSENYRRSCGALPGAVI